MVLKMHNYIDLGEIGFMKKAFRSGSFLQKFCLRKTIELQIYYWTIESLTRLLPKDNRC